MSSEAFNRYNNPNTNVCNLDGVSFAQHISSLVKNYSKHQDHLVFFLSTFEEDETLNGHGRKKYLVQLEEIVNGKAKCLKIWVADLVKFFSQKPDEGNSENDIPYWVVNNCMRYIELFYAAAEFVRKSLNIQKTKNYMTCVSTNVDDNNNNDLSFTECERGMGNFVKMDGAKIPAHLRVPYEIRIIPITTKDVLSIRDVDSKYIGKLIQMEGVVIKVFPVKSCLQIADYRCHDCDSSVYHTTYGLPFKPLAFCESDSCKSNLRKGDLKIDLLGSKFVMSQEIEVQELTYRLPLGSVARSRMVVVEGSLIGRLSLGMSVMFSGVLMPVQRTSNFFIKSSLIMSTVFHVQDIFIQKGGLMDSYESVLTNKEAPEENEIFEIYKNDTALYERMARSIAPSIHGLEDVKKSLLLQMVGGISKKLHDGSKLRGDIHVLLMGDPGIAKSQLLRQVCKIAPKAYYTNGNGSSGVGLTASVIRDSITGGYTIEAGTIVLSDNGICAIDEFDKMEENDRTAIHEVMEQQTVSISKAGINTMLNAKTSILAAANPQNGRYDLKKSPMQNINLPASLLSRFDLQFILLDKADQKADYILARHILKIHQAAVSSAKVVSGSTPVTSEISGSFCGAASDGQFELTCGDGFRSMNFVKDVLDTSTLRILIGKAKTFNPKIPSNLIEDIVHYYVDLRQVERLQAVNNSLGTYTTPRTLLAVVRLSCARARLRFSNLVDRGDLEESMRLIMESKRSLLNIIETNRSKKTDDYVYQSEVFNMLKTLYWTKSYEENWDGWIPMLTAKDVISRSGYTAEQLESTIACYVDLGVLRWKNEIMEDFRFQSNSL